MDAPQSSLPSRRRPPALAVTVIIVAFMIPLVALGFVAAGPGPDDPCAGHPVDIGFATDMLDHHQQALQMSLVAVDKAVTTPVRSLAVRMVTGQQLESGRFMQLLEEQGRHEGDPGREVMGWMGMPMPRDRMPGLIPPDRLLALTNATGPQVDRLFLELMIRHHEGGLHMSEHAAEHACQAPLRGAAGRMIVTQRREIGDMRELLAGLG